jgi:prepilin-type N-terminal cleavage/methylation domain-containing protein
MKIKNRKGFTLIELLVVIAIIAVLSVVVILSLNPAELLKQARDSNRISDMATLKSAISLYLADVNSPNLASSSVTTPYGTVFVTLATTSAPTLAGWGVTIANYTTSTATTSRAINSTGWIPVNFNSISSGAPVGSLPLDPTNAGLLYYGYLATSTNLSFKLTAHTESGKYSTGGGADIETGDGGLSTSTFEQGTNLTL